MADVALLTLALLSSFCGMSWLALTQDAHFQQVRGQGAHRTGRARGVRTLGYGAAAASLALCLCVDHASIASLVWIMMQTATALLVSFTLAFRPRWLAFLALDRR